MNAATPSSQPPMAPGDAYALGYNDGSAGYASREDEVRAREASADTDNAFQVRCPGCQKLYVGKWNQRVCVHLRWLDCACGLKTRLESQDPPAGDVVCMHFARVGEGVTQVVDALASDCPWCRADRLQRDLDWIGRMGVAIKTLPGGQRAIVDEWQRRTRPDLEFEGLLAAFGTAMSLWTTGAGTHEAARAASEAVLAHFYGESFKSLRTEIASAT